MKNILLITINIFSLISYVPQIVKLIRCKHAAGVSRAAYGISLTVFVCYILYAFLTEDWGLLVTMSIQMVMCALIIVLATHYTGSG